MENIVIMVLLAISAWSDIKVRLIPDWISVSIALLGIVTSATTGWSTLMLSIATSATLFAVLLAVAMRGWLGGGDVKLAAALATGLPPATTWDFITATVLAGGVLGLGYLVGPRFAPHLSPAGPAHPLARILAIEAWRLRRGGPLPYGVAIAAGGIFVLLTTPG